MHSWSFAKGHGTGNDFVLLLDRHGMTDPSPEAVQYLCDRHRGLGADGLLRVVPGSVVPDWSHELSQWFMDYRNADGSVAEMCGNGARVFARYLLDNDLASGPEFTIGTRAGAKTIQVLDGGDIRVGMGTVTVGDDVVVRHDGRDWPAIAADVGNPHAVVLVHRSDLVELDLARTPTWDPPEAFPEGVNVEFLAPPEADRTAVMRVHERGVGETLSCGTGTVAAAAVLGQDRAEAHVCPMTVPGGRVEVALGELDGRRREASLTGPAVIVAEGEVHLPTDLPDDRLLR